MSSPESVTAKLKNKAKEQGQNFSRILLLYFQERFLARLSQSKYQDKLILKGGLYLYSVYGMATRPTKDIDFLGIDSSQIELEAVFREIVSIELDDSVEFDVDSLTSKPIQAGIHISLSAYLGRANNVLKFDIGFNDTVTPAPQITEYPSFLSDETIPIYSYNVETLIAEKFAAMTELYLGNSRLKDFYDLYQSAQRGSINQDILQSAIRETFKQRNLELSEHLKLFEPEFSTDTNMVRRWKAVWKKEEDGVAPEFSEVLMAIEKLVKLSN